MENLEMQSDRFWDSMQAIDHGYEEYAKATGMTYMSMTVLKEIYEHTDGCTQKQICEVTHYPKQSVNLIVKSFWESGYVELKENPTDRRNKTIVFTAKGREYADRVVGALWQVDKEVMGQFTAEEQAELLRMLNLYEKGFCEKIQGLIQAEQ